MFKIRFYVLITFSDEDVLIDFISLLNECIGKYDFFTQNIKNTMGDFNGDRYGRYPKLRIFSFKKIYSYRKLASLLRKSENVNRKLAERGFSHFNIGCGFMQGDQVVSIQKKFDPNTIMIKKNLCAQIQMIFSKGKPQTLPASSPEYINVDIKKFFTDLYRIYRDQVGP